jgi:branched-subunit amino acid transport protein
MVLATYPVRLLPLVALSARGGDLPGAVVRWLNYVPIAVFSAMVFPGVLAQEGRLHLEAANPHLWAGLVTVLIAVATRSLGKAVLGGVTAAFVARWLLSAFS